MSDQLLQNGWTPVYLDPRVLVDLLLFNTAPRPLLVSEITFPSHDPIVVQVQDYVKEKLSMSTYNHCMRTFYFGAVIMAHQFPQHAADLSPSTFALAALLHKIGTADEHLFATKMSFEFYGAIVAYNFLQTLGASQDQVEATCEAIIRHQDVGGRGRIPLLGQILQLATLYDNVSEHRHIFRLRGLIHTATREDVNKAFPRHGWSRYFASTLSKELDLKPWCHTTHIDVFTRWIEDNLCR